MLQVKKLLLFGDSITQFSCGRCESVEEAGRIDGFSLGSGLGAVYNRKLDVVTRGFSGYNTRWCLPVLDAVLDAELQGQTEVALSVIFFGSNDSVSDGPQRVPLEEYCQNIVKMVGKMKAAKIKTVLVTPARVDKQQWSHHFAEDAKVGYVRSDALYKEYRDQLLKIGEQEGIPVVDLYTEFGKHDVSSLLTDGIHFSSEGYRVFFLALMKTIRENLPELAPENLPWHLPYWRDVTEDPTSVIAALNKY